MDADTATSKRKLSRLLIGATAGTADPVLNMAECASLAGFSIATLY